MSLVQNKSTSNIRIAMIGSRNLEKIAAYAKQIEIYFDYCYQLAKAGVVMSSGLCLKGPDGLAQKAYAKAIDEGLASTSQLEVYVCDQSMIRKSPLPYKELSIVMPPELKGKRVEWLSKVMTQSHIAACDDYALGQHQRNVHQILGLDLNSPVDAVFTWCLLNKDGSPMGGTATAFNLATQLGIPVVNLFNTKPEEVTIQLNKILGAQHEQTI